MKSRLKALVLVMILTLGVLTGCGKKQASNELKIGLEGAYPPFNWTQMDDSNGAVKIEGSKEYVGGYDVEIAKKLAEKMGKELVVVKTEWNGLVPALESDVIDVIMAGMSPTEERKKSIDFSDTYYTSDLVMIVKKGSKFDKASSLKDFEGAKITGQLNTFHYDVVSQIPKVKKQAAMEDFTSMRVALESGMIDGYVSERPEGISAESNNENFKMIELKDGFKTSKEDTSIAVGIKKDSELTKEINKYLSEISEEERQKIMDEVIKKQPASNK